MRNLLCGCLSVACAIACLGCSSGAYPDPFTERYDIRIRGRSFQLVGEGYVAAGRDHLLYYSRGVADAVFSTAQAGGYAVHVFCAGTVGGKELPRFKLYVDGRPVGVETSLTSLDPGKYVFEVALRAGEHRLGVEYTNDFFFIDERGELLEDRNFVLIGVGLRKVR